MGQRRKSWTAGEMFRTLWGQDHAAAVLLHVRPELGQSLSFLYVADGWIRSELVSGQPRRGVRRHRQSAGCANQCVGHTTRMVADPAGIWFRVNVSSGLQVPGGVR